MALPTGPVPEQPVRLVPPAPEPVASPLAGDPGLLGLPSFIVGAVAIGLVFINVLPTATAGAAVPIVLAATATGLFLATIWAAIIGHTAEAGIYGVFAGFYFSYAVLVLGLTHNWFGITPAALVDSQKLFVITWMVIVTMLVLASLRLPFAYTALFTLVDVALLLDLLGFIQVSSATNLTKAAGWVVMAFSALGVYLFLGAANHATGGKPFPLGRPILR